MKTNTTLLLSGLALISLAVPVETLAADNSGFLYATVETASGETYEGFLRWGREESFWGDHFNASKEELPFEDERDLTRGARRRQVEILGTTFRWHGSDWGGRSLVARFGDIDEIEFHRRDDITVRMKTGTEFDLEGGSNDIGADITLHDASGATVKLAWREIGRVRFSAAPPDHDPPAGRLYGALTTEDDETFEGWIQWDIHECLTTDELDGETDDGDVSIEMGRIQAIEKRNRHGAWVELEDGQRLLLEDTNDVDDSTDGIFVEDDRFGRVQVSWDAFDRLELRHTSGSGPGYDDFEPGRKLAGKVTDEDGNVHSGEIVFDLDESESWEMLNGDIDGVEYHIPFEKIRAIRPLGRHAAEVELIGGIALELEEQNDVTDDNAGVVVVSGDEKTLIEWSDIESIEFDPAAQ